jgi:hypothetical protein
MAYTWVTDVQNSLQIWTTANILNEQPLRATASNGPPASGLGKDPKHLTIKNQHVTKCYTAPQTLTSLLQSYTNRKLS